MPSPANSCFHPCPRAMLIRPSRVPLYWAPTRAFSDCTCIWRRTTSRGYVTVWPTTPATAPQASFAGKEDRESSGKRPFNDSYTKNFNPAYGSMPHIVGPAHYPKKTRYEYLFISRWSCKWIRHTWIRRNEHQTSSSIENKTKVAENDATKSMSSYTYKLRDTGLELHPLGKLLCRHP